MHCKGIGLGCVSVMECAKCACVGTVVAGTRSEGDCSGGAGWVSEL